MGVRGGSLAVDGSTKGPMGLPEVEAAILFIYAYSYISRINYASFRNAILNGRVRVEVDQSRNVGRESHAVQDEVIILILSKKHLRSQLNKRSFQIPVLPRCSTTVMEL